MKTILETTKRKWTEYLLEILVIVIGILLAFALNNWNEQRKNLRVEQYYLKGIKTSLVKSKIELDRVIIKTNRVSEKNLELILLSKSKIDDLPFLAIDTLISSTGYTIYTPDEGIVHEILNSNNLSLIQNEFIRSYIASWDSRNRKIRNYEEFVKLQTIKYGDFLSDFIDYSNEKENVSIIVHDKRIEFLSSTKLRYHLDLTRGMSDVVNDLYLEEKDILDSLEILVTKEIMVNKY